MIDGRGQVIIMDFGLAGLQDQVQSDIRSGTPAYMSPEQLEGREVTMQSDIYALGLVLHELFTGKRAFDAPSVDALIKMQRTSRPSTVSSTAKDVDPAIERVIERCLAPDPAQRPASAMAVAAALPGGNLLEAAMAAGETPSPELVAAAGESEGMRPAVATAWLGVGLTSLLAVALLMPRQELVNKIPLEAAPEALAHDARNMLRSFGYSDKPVDSGYGLTYAEDYRDYLKKHPEEAAAQWKHPAAGDVPLIRFWYRESRFSMVPQSGFNVQLSYNDPPPEQDGMLRIRLDPDGKLLQLEAVAPQLESASGAGGPFDFGKLFQAAGLDQSQFQSAAPEWTPLNGWDQRSAWVRGRLRVEAAAWRGRPVFFRVIGPWSIPERSMPDPGRPLSQLVVVYTLFLGSGAVAWWNFRRGKVDIRGARFLAVLYWIPICSAGALAAHHAATSSENTLLWRVVSIATINAGVVFLIYLAIEPFVRRYWPQTMISWSRFAVKGLRDPLVGSDILRVMPIAALMAITNWASPLLGVSNGEPLTPQLMPLLGLRWTLAQILGSTASISDAVASVVVLFLFRMILRNQAAAVVAFVIMAGLTEFAIPFHWAPIALAMLYSVAQVWVVLRIGLLGAIVAALAGQILSTLPHTLDLSNWWAGPALLPLIFLAGATIFAFRTALGKQTLLAPATSGR